MLEEASSSLPGFTDSETISNWAKEAAETAEESGIVSGANGASFAKGQVNIGPEMTES